MLIIIIITLIKLVIKKLVGNLYINLDLYVKLVCNKSICKIRI